MTSHTATWTFDAPFNADQHYLSLSETVTDAGGNQLDGEWTNPFSLTTTNTAVDSFASNGSSGDGSAGGDFNFVFTILPGDADQDNDVDGSDFFQWMFGSSSADFNGDGATDDDDLTIWQENYGRNLRDLMFADFNGDGIVNMSDYWSWSMNYGVTGAEHSQGDVDNDGDVDGSDFIFLFRQWMLELDWVG